MFDSYFGCINRKEMKVKLPILFETEETQALKNVGIDPSLEDSEINVITFYNINGISKYMEDHNYTNIYSNGMCFISNLRLDEVEKIIDEL